MQDILTAVLHESDQILEKLYFDNKIKCEIFSVFPMLISAANDHVWFYLVLWCLTPLLTFNNTSVMSWRSVLLVEKTGGTGENYRPVASH